MLLLLALSNFILAVFDVWLSRKRMLAYGLSVELNSAIRTLSALLGTEFGTILGVLVPSSALIGLCLWTHFSVGLAFMLGMRAKMFIIQIQSMLFEKEVKQIKAELDIRGLRALPPARLSDSCGAKPTVRVVDDSEALGLVPPKEGPSHE